MKLKVTASSATYRGRSYARHDVIEIDHRGHNGARDIRALTLLGKVEEIKEPKPVRRVGTTRRYPTRRLTAED